MFVHPTIPRCVRSGTDLKVYRSSLFRADCTFCSGLDLDDQDDLRWQGIGSTGDARVETVVDLARASFEFAIEVMRIKLEWSILEHRSGGVAKNGT